MYSHRSQSLLERRSAALIGRCPVAFRRGFLTDRRAALGRAGQGETGPALQLTGSVSFSPDFSVSEDPTRADVPTDDSLDHPDMAPSLERHRGYVLLMVMLSDGR